MVGRSAWVAVRYGWQVGMAGRSARLVIWQVIRACSLGGFEGRHGCQVGMAVRTAGRANRQGWQMRRAGRSTGLAGWGNLQVGKAGGFTRLAENMVKPFLG